MILFGTIVQLVIVTVIILVIYVSIRNKYGDKNKIIKMLFKFFLYFIWIVGFLGYMINKRGLGLGLLVLLIIGTIVMKVNGVKIGGILERINNFLNKIMDGPTLSSYSPTKPANKKNSGYQMVLNNANKMNNSPIKKQKNINKYQNKLTKYSKIKKDLLEGKDEIIDEPSKIKNIKTILEEKYIDLNTETEKKEEKFTQLVSLLSNAKVKQKISQGKQQKTNEKPQISKPINPKKTIDEEPKVEFEKTDHIEKSNDNQKSEDMFNSKGGLFDGSKQSEKSKSEKSGLFEKSSLFD